MMGLDERRQRLRASYVDENTWGAILERKNTTLVKMFHEGGNILYMQVFD